MFIIFGFRFTFSELEKDLASFTAIVEIFNFSTFTSFPMSSWKELANVSEPDRVGETNVALMVRSSGRGACFVSDNHVLHDPFIVVDFSTTPRVVESPAPFARFRSNRWRHEVLSEKVVVHGQGMQYPRSFSKEK